MILVLAGEDALAIRRRLLQLREAADGGSGMLDTNLATFSGRETKPFDVLAAASAPPFLAPSRLVVVEDLLERFEGRADGPRAQRAADLKPWQQLLDALPTLPPTTTLVFVGGSGKGNAFVEAMKRAAPVEVEVFPRLERDELWRWVRSEAALQGVRFRNGPSRRPLAPEDEWARPKTPDPAIHLATLHNGDTLAIANQLAKLALYTMGREATVDDVDVICWGEHEDTIFQFLDAVQDGNLGFALTMMKRFEETQDNHQGTLSMLLRAYRQSAIVLDLLEEGADEETIGKAINRTWPRGRQEAIRRARALGREGVRRAFELIVEADRAHKTGLTEEAVAMELLLARLAALAPAGRTRRRP